MHWQKCERPLLTCDICLGLAKSRPEYEKIEPPEKVVGGDSVAEFWQEHSIFWGVAPGCEQVFGGPGNKLSPRDQYDLKTMNRPVKDSLDDLRDRLEVERIKAEWAALIEAVGEERAPEARKLYDVRAYPRNLELLPTTNSARLEIEWAIVIKPRNPPSLTQRVKENGDILLCAACEQGDHKWHQFASEELEQECNCPICNR